MDKRDPLEDPLWVLHPKLNTEESPEMKMEKNLGTMEKIPMFQCALCGVKFHLAAHLIAHVEKGIHCNIDGENEKFKKRRHSEQNVKKTPTVTGVTQQEQLLESSDSEKDCNNINATEEISLPKPRTLVKEEEILPHFTHRCLECTSIFESTKELKLHLNVHTNIEDKDKSKEINALQIVNIFESDVLIESVDGCYRCTVCGKMCIARSDMQKHVRRHTNERPYACTICPERFKHRSAITNHMRIHTGEKPYSCLYCGKKFSQPSNKRRHEALHRGERPFPCPICERSFSEKTTLQTHLLQHTGQRPFVCDVCGKGHVTNSALNSHKKRRHKVA